MKDIRFDFPNNDVAVTNGDFGITEDPSVQNATLILLKNPVNTMSAQWGVGAEMFTLNASQGYVYALVAEARRQVLKDGAQSCTMSVRPGDMFGDYDIAVDAQYPMGDTPPLKEPRPVPDPGPDPDPDPDPDPPTPTGRAYEITAKATSVNASGETYDVQNPTMAIKITKADGSQSDWLPPTEVRENTLLVWTGTGASTGQITLFITVTKTGYETIESAQRNYGPGNDKFTAYIPVTMNEIR